MSMNVSNDSNKIVLFTIAVGTLFVIALVLFIFNSDDLRERGVGGEDGVLGGDFTLTHVNGDVSLSDFKGKVVMLYFGFVNCSQVCPISMKNMQLTLESMQPEEAEKIEVLLVSVDVDNDNAELVDKYVKDYSDKFIGLTGTVDQINLVVDEYGSYYSPTELKEIDEGRAFRHSSRYYLINQEGELVDAMRHSTTPNELKARLRQLI